MAVSQTFLACEARRNRSVMNAASRTRAVPERIRKTRRNGRAVDVTAQYKAEQARVAQAAEATLLIGVSCHAASIAADRMRRPEVQAEVRAIILCVSNHSEQWAVNGASFEQALLETLYSMDASKEARAWFKRQSII